MRMSKNILRTKERNDLLPFLLGIMRFNNINVKGSITDPDYKDGFYQIAFERMVSDDTPDQIMTYQYGAVDHQHVTL